MHFCIVTPFFPSKENSGGGVGIHYKDLTDYIAPYCDEVTLLHISDQAIDEEIQLALPDNVHVVHLQDNFNRIPGNPFSLSTKIRKRLSRLILNIKVALRILVLDRKKRIDILETTNYLYLCLSYTFLPDRKPLITRFSSSTGQLRQYGNWRSSKIDLIELLEMWMFKRSYVMLSHTYEHRRLIAEPMNIPRKRIQIIPHGTSISDHHLVTYEDDPGSKTELTILFLGRLESRKGIQTFLDSIPTLLEAHPNLRFRIAGYDPDNGHELRFQKEHAQYASQVTFLGEVSHDQKVQEYQSCDIFAAPSLYESFGLIYVEAMSFGKPVIGCRAGGTIEVIKDKAVGYLIEPGSVPELIEAIRELIENHDLRMQMGRAAKERVETYFTATIMAKNSYRALETIRSDWNYRL